ncbi:hypothetical protein ABBQ32_013708 [Trebouxia sp. C0010 RCD-2024]
MQRLHSLRALRDRVSTIRQCTCHMSTRESSSRSGTSWNLEQTLKEGLSKAANIFENAVLPGSAWAADKMPDLTGKTYLVTGANSGIGFQAAKQLAKRNAVVTIASRNEASGRRAVDEIQRLAPGSQVNFSHVDLESFKSIQHFADRFLDQNAKLDCIINNAGVFMPEHRKTPEGFEVTLGTNYFGPFFLTHLLMDRLRASAPARIVWVVSSLEVVGDITWDDLKGTHAATSDMTAYGTSKLMTIMSNIEMVKRLQGSGIDSFICQPGMSSTPVYGKTDKSHVMANVLDAAQKVLGQTEERGAVSLLYAATAPEVSGKSGTYIGPYYIGPFISNMFNTGSQQPLNRWTSDAAACTRMYNETVRLVHEANDGQAAATTPL